MSLSLDAQEAFRAAVREMDTINGRELFRLQERVASLYNAISHGDEKHRAWLKRAIDSHFGGQPVETVQ